MASSRLDQAIALFDAANDADPNTVEMDGKQVGRERVHAHRLSVWVASLAGEKPSEALQLAARCQHLCRWEIPRNQYPDGRAGYLKWREELKKLHAEKATAILQKVGYEMATIERVRTIVQKKNLASDSEVQIMEDALCLFFLEEQFADLAAKEAAKIVDIVRKTWAKMSPAAREIALTMPLSPEHREIVEEALKGA